MFGQNVSDERFGLQDIERFARRHPCDDISVPLVRQDLHQLDGERNSSLSPALGESLRDVEILYLRIVVSFVFLGFLLLAETSKR